MLRNRLLRAAALVLVFIVYFTAGKLGLKLAFVHQSATAVWAPTGIAIAALLILGRWIWPGILLGAFFVNVTTPGSSILTSGAIAVGNTLEGIVGAFLVGRFARGRNAFDRPQDVFKFALLAGICSTAISATMGVTSLCLAGTATWANYGAIWLTWWLGDAAGDFVVAPVLILWAGRPKLTIDRRDVVHATLLIACLFVVSMIVFGRGHPLEFLCIPVLIWAAFRFGPRGAATTSLLLATIALSATLWGFGPFVTRSLNESLLLLQTYIGVSSVMALAVAAVVWDREQVRQQLLRQATELRLVIDGMPGLVSYVDRHFRYRFLNRRYAEWFGRPTEGLVNQTVAEAFGAVLFEKIRPYAERALAGEALTFEHSHSYKGDRLRQVRATYVPDQAEDGSVRGFVVVVEDITEQHQSQESQKALEQQLMLLIEASSTLLASPESPEVLRSILAMAKRFVEAAAYAVWRKTEDSLEWRMIAVDGLSKHYQRIVSDVGGRAASTLREPFIVEDIEQAPLVGDRVAAYRAEGIRSLLTIPLRIRDETAGTIVFYYRSPHRFTAIETRIAVALGNLAAAALGTSTLYEQQTTLRRSAESAERRSRFLAQAGAVLSSSLDYEATLASVADLAVPAFADWASVDVIQESGEVQRLAVKHIDPKKIALAYEYSRRYPPRDTEATQVALRTGKSVLMEDIPESLIIERARDEEHARFLRELGVKSVIIAPLVARRRTFGTLTFVTAESGRRYSKVDLELAEELASRAATAVDNARLFTESKRVQEELRRRNDELRRANENLNQFAYSASHDLREPLRIVVIYSQLLRKNYRGKLDAEADEYLDFTEQGAKRMETLIGDLLAYTQAVNIADEEITPVNAGDVMAKVLSNLKETIRESGAVVTYGVLPILRIHETHLLQLFQNLVVNSIKYRGKEPPRIEITSERLGEQWKTSVRDNGIGIPPKYAQTVFGLFKRLHSSSQHSGTGIGLAICQKIVDRYGGRIWVESEEGQGSNFCFTLPAAD